MPTKPKRKCNYPGCPQLTKETYCEEHDKKVKQSYEADRETAVKRGYTHRWHKVRTWKINKDPMCEWCALKRRTTVADLVHHLDKDSHNNEMDNLISLCTQCHDDIHKDDRFKPK